MTHPAWEPALAALPECWRAALGPAFAMPLMDALAAFLQAERAAGKAIYPPEPLVFAALRHTPLARVKAVILGQDPYHRPGQAMGLSFSVPVGVRIPPSLRNIHRELAADCGLPAPDHGCLTRWADQGVLLLNTALTVEEGKAGSHARAGWHGFTDAVLRAVDARPDPVAFLLWGGHARQRAKLLTGTRHRLLESDHPSPLAAAQAARSASPFAGSRPFSRANDFLRAQGRDPVDWRL
ncbi:uracil-DNA glycosylase [Pseudoroseomonas cervicalis]|uniref:Uracil-DNA glycosylase n=1 Tax=Pseudoroseomonas cervicalis ATCC 49957 TaxID=525371 RepID=D5RKP0_9PROT|nr:uracil-DNA glycosylase [Pseudoroseomonas cervicalis]EFH12126.1 uracil-DNA glycosylase [Pseudoroseomonas cervicalis ATCC 49957]